MGRFRTVTLVHKLSCLLFYIVITFVYNRLSFAALHGRSGLQAIAKVRPLFRLRLKC